jgi:hypothetical protein
MSPVFVHAKEAIEKQGIAPLHARLLQCTYQAKWSGRYPYQFSIRVDCVWGHEVVFGGLSTLRSGTIHILHLCEGYQDPFHSRDPGQFLTRGPILLSIYDQDIRRFKRVGYHWIRHTGQYHNAHRVVDGELILAFDLGLFGSFSFTNASDIERIDDEGGYRITLGSTSIQAAPDRRLVKLLDLEYIPCLSIDLSTGQISGHYTMRLSISGWLWKVVMHRISVTRFKGDLQRVRPCIRQMEKHWHCTCRSVCASSRYLPPGQLER